MLGHILIYTYIVIMLKGRLLAKHAHNSVFVLTVETFSINKFSTLAQ